MNDSDNPMRFPNEGGLSIVQAWHAALDRAEEAERENAELRAVLSARVQEPTAATNAPQSLQAQEILFYAQCQLAGMQAANQERLHQGLSIAYRENVFVGLAEETRAMFRACLR